MSNSENFNKFKIGGKAAPEIAFKIIMTPSAPTAGEEKKSHCGPTKNAAFLKINPFTCIVHPMEVSENPKGKSSKIPKQDAKFKPPSSSALC